MVPEPANADSGINLKGPAQVYRLSIVIQSVVQPFKLFVFQHHIDNPGHPLLLNLLNDYYFYYIHPLLMKFWAWSSFGWTLVRLFFFYFTTVWYLSLLSAGSFNLFVSKNGDFFKLGQGKRYIEYQKD